MIFRAAVFLRPAVFFAVVFSAIFVPHTIQHFKHRLIANLVPQTSTRGRHYSDGYGSPRVGSSLTPHVPSRCCRAGRARLRFLYPLLCLTCCSSAGGGHGVADQRRPLKVLVGCGSSALEARQGFCSRRLTASIRQASSGEQFAGRVGLFLRVDGLQCARSANARARASSSCLFLGRTITGGSRCSLIFQSLAPAGLSLPQAQTGAAQPDTAPARLPRLTGSVA